MYKLGVRDSFIAVRIVAEHIVHNVLNFELVLAEDRHQSLTDFVGFEDLVVVAVELDEGVPDVLADFEGEGEVFEFEFADSDHLLSIVFELLL